MTDEGEYYLGFINTAQGCPYWDPSQTIEVKVYPHAKQSSDRSVLVRRTRPFPQGDEQYLISRHHVYATREEALGALYDDAKNHLQAMEKHVQDLGHAILEERRKERARHGAA